MKKCDRCGKELTEKEAVTRFEPYDRDVHDIKTPIIWCDDCYCFRVEEI